MTDRAQALLREALASPLEERADVAELVASLHGTEPEYYISNQQRRPSSFVVGPIPPCLVRNARSALHPSVGSNMTVPCRQSQATRKQEGR